MSGTKQLPRPGGVRPAARPSRKALAVGAGLAVAVAGGGVAALTVFGGSDAPRGGPTDPITLPATVDGLSPQAADKDLTRRDDWLKEAAGAAPGRTVSGRTYGTTAKERSIQLVAARTDLKGKLSLGWAGDAGTDVDGARCTHNVTFDPAVPPRERPTVVLCWRTSATFSTYAFAVDPTAKTAVPFTAAAKAVNSVWKTAAGG